MLSEKTKEYQKQYREQHREESKVYQQEYYQTNKDKILKRQFLYSKSHPENAKKSKEKWRLRNRDVILEKYKKWKRTLKGCLCTKLSHLKKHRHSVEITVEHLFNLWDKQGGRCAITGKKMEYEYGKTPYTVSVDRIDSDFGYSEENVQLVCQSINFAKNNFTNEEFKHFWQNDALVSE